MAGCEMEPPASVKGCFSQRKPKHTIFLSHSGDDKSFVEQLSLDLERMNHSPFFDQNPDSLPKGERFPSLIFEAAEQCQLAVVVLSEGYLSSKWPMLELSAFLKAKKGKNPNLKLFPLFYKLSPSDLGAEMVKTKWMKKWEGLIQVGAVQAEAVSFWSDAVKSLLDAKNVEMEWEKALMEQLVQGEVEAEDFSKLFGEAVRELRPFNGLEFRKYGNSEVKYRAAVVHEICRCVPPMMEIDTERIRGYDRLCEIISSMFEEVVREESSSSNWKHAPQYLGLYGMGGVGKTTLCRAMCSFFQQAFRGRVCHVELQMDSSSERLERMKAVVRKLAGFDNTIVERITNEEEGLACLKNRLRDQPAVFLAVDNVGDSQSSRDEAQAYLDAGFACGSKVLVTSRSQTLLKIILKEAIYCKPIPRLEEMEASEVFLSVAAPGLSLSSLHPHEQKIIKACLEECQFADDGYPSRQYHPLVLKALGAYFYDIDGDHNVKKWEVALKEEKKLQMSRESKNVFDILGLNYETLDDMQKLIFLDVAFLINQRFAAHYYNLNRSNSMELCDRKACDNWQVSFIATLHGISPLAAGMKVKELQRKSLINESSQTLTMHDLYSEFALKLIEKEGSKERGWWVGNVEKNVGDIPELKRLVVSSETKLWRVPPKYQECRNLVYLVLCSCDGLSNSSDTLDLGVLKKLRVLIIEFCWRLVNIVCSCGNSSNGLNCMMGYEGCLSELRTVRFSLTGVKSTPFLRHCGNLQSLCLSGCDLNPSDFVEGETSVLKCLKKLEVLRLVYNFYHLHEMSMTVLYKILRVTSTLRNLRVVEVRLDDRSKVLPDLEDSAIFNLSLLEPLSSLSVLSLPSLPDFIRELKGLDQLQQLTTLILYYSKGLRKLPDLHLVPNLRQVCFNECCNLDKDTTALLRKFQDLVDVEYGYEHGIHKCREPRCNSTECNVCEVPHMRFLCNPPGYVCQACFHVQLGHRLRACVRCGFPFC